MRNVGCEIYIYTSAALSSDTCESRKRKGLQPGLHKILIIRSYTRYWSIAGNFFLMKKGVLVKEVDSMTPCFFGGTYN